MERKGLFDYNLEESPLQIKTDSRVGTNDEVRVWLRSSQVEIVGGVEFLFSSPPRYKLWDCRTNRKDLPSNLPTDTNKVWTISLDRTEGVRLVVHCNDVEVVDFLMSDSTCNHGKWKTRWMKSVGKIEFTHHDNASDYYRPGKSCSILINTFQRLMYRDTAV